MAFYKQDIVDVNLETGVIHRSFLNHTIGHKDADADRFGVRVFRNGTAEDLTGVSCQAIFMAPDGTNIALTSYGTVSGNEAYVTLPQACYNVEGQFCLAIKLVGGGVTATVRIIDGVVDRTGATGAVAPTEAVPTYQEILAVYAEMQEDVADYESVVATQDGKIDDLKSALTQYDIVNLLDYNDTTDNSPKQTGGITYTNNMDGSFTVTGVSTGTNFFAIYINDSSLPAWMEPGEKYRMLISISGNSGTSPRISTAFVINGEAESYTNYYKDTIIEVPSTATGFRLRITCSSSVTLSNAKISVGFIKYAYLPTEARAIVDGINAITPNINSDSQSSFSSLKDIIAEIGDTKTYVYFGTALYLRGRIHYSKSFDEIISEGDVTVSTSPSGFTPCIEIPFDRTLCINIATKRLSIENRNYNGTDKIALFYINTSGFIKGGIGYRNYIAQIAEKASSQVVSIPCYFETQVATKISSVVNNMATAERNGFTVIHITDAHPPKNTGNSQKIINYLLQNTRVKYVLHNGDIINSHESTKASALNIIRNYVSTFDFNRGYTMFNIGNHEYNMVSNEDPSTYLTVNDFYSVAMANMRSVTFYEPGAYHYYMIDQASNTALICLQTKNNYGALPSADATALTNLIDTLNVDHIIVACHMFFNVDGNHTYNNSIATQILTAIGAATNKSKVAAIMVGHTHDDYNTVIDGIPVFTTTCDSYKEVGDSAIGTTTELAFDIVTFDFTNSVIKCVRIGRGSDRTISLP